ncbi:MAG: PilZ domain-containing protein [Nitrospira sp.]|nr:PilZ domain-containing protein [Nitrospira sp.]
MLELRTSQRVQADLPVSFATYDINGLREGALYNLSKHGCAVESPTTVEVGSHAALYIHAPGEESPIVIELASIQRASRREFGAKFLLIQSHERKRLEQLVQKLLRGSAQAPSLETSRSSDPSTEQVALGGPNRKALAG